MISSYADEIGCKTYIAYKEDIDRTNYLIYIRWDRSYDLSCLQIWNRSYDLSHRRLDPMSNATGSFRMSPNVRNEYCGNDDYDDENDDDCDDDGGKKEWSTVVDC